MTDILSLVLIGIYLIFQISLILMTDFSAKAYIENLKLRRGSFQIYIVDKGIQEKPLPEKEPKKIYSLNLITSKKQTSQLSFAPVLKKPSCYVI